MTSRHKVSRTAIELVKRFEGYRQRSAQLPDGRWTIGYGHTASARRGAEVSEADAEALLIYDLLAVAQAVNEQVFAPLTQNQFDALCAFAFNVGLDAFRNSEVLQRLNQGEVLRAAYAMEMWRKAKLQGHDVVVDALVRRRSAEKTLFLMPPGGAWPIAPTPVLKPGLDLDIAGLAPREEPIPVTTPLEGDEAIAVPEREPEPVLPEAPPPPDEDSVTAVAAAVTARLETLFKDDLEPAPAPEAPAEPTEPAPEPAAEPASAGPIDILDEPFTLTSPEAEAEGLVLPLDDLVSPPDEGEEAGSPTGDLFDEAPAAANDPMAAEMLATAEPNEDVPENGDDAPRERVVIDDTAPFEFVPAQVQAQPPRASEGYLSLAVLAVVGLAFLAGGLFWAVNAQPGAEPAFMTPRIVGALASVAGVGVFAIAVYLLLQRLGRDAERSDTDRRP